MLPMLATLGNWSSATNLPRSSMVPSCRSRITPRTRKATSGTASNRTRRLAMFMELVLGQLGGSVRRVRVFLAYSQDLRQNADELLDQFRIEACARFALKQRDSVLDGPGLLVR